MFLFEALHVFGVGIDFFSPHLDDDLWRFLQSSLLALLAQSWVESISFVYFESNFTLLVPRNINIESSHFFIIHKSYIYNIYMYCQILH